MSSVAVTIALRLARESNRHNDSTSSPECTVDSTVETQEADCGTGFTCEEVDGVARCRSGLKTEDRLELDIKNNSLNSLEIIILPDRPI